MNAVSVIIILDKLLEKPTQYMLHQSTGKAYMKLGDWRKAAALFMKHIQLSPSALSTWEELGIAYYKLKKFTAAMKAFKKVLSGKRPGIRSEIFLALTLSSLGRIKESLSTLDNLLQKKQSSIILLLCSKLILSFASWNLRKGASQNAFILAKRAAILAGKFVKRHGNNSMGHKIVGDATFLLTRVMHINIILLDPFSKTRTVSLIEQLKMSMQTATRSFSKAIHLHPDLSPGWRDLAVPLSTWPKDSETSIFLADRCLLSGIRISPLDGIAWKNLALAWSSRNVAKALYGIKRSLLLSKYDCESWIAFACLLKGQEARNLRGYALQQGRQCGSDLYHWYAMCNDQSKSISYDHIYRIQSSKDSTLNNFSPTEFLSGSLNKLHLSPVSTIFLNGWGLALARSGNWTAAANAHIFSLLARDLDNSEDRTYYFLSRALTAMKYHVEEENKSSSRNSVVFLILNALRKENEDFSVSEAVKSDILSDQKLDSTIFLDAILCLLRSKHLSCEEFHSLMQEIPTISIPTIRKSYRSVEFMERFRFLYAEVWKRFGMLEAERVLKDLVENDAVSSEAYDLVRVDAKLLLDILSDVKGLRLRLKSLVDKVIIEKKFSKLLHATPWLRAKDVYYSVH